jgi:hypothetical protein
MALTVTSMRVPCAANGGRLAVTSTGGHVAARDVGAAGVDAEALEHGLEALLRARCVAQAVTGPIEPDDQAIAHKLVSRTPSMSVMSLMRE